MIPGSGISSKSPGYVPAKSISYGRRQVTEFQKERNNLSVLFVQNNMNEVIKC